MALARSDIDIDSIVAYRNNDIAYTAVRISHANIEGACYILLHLARVQVPDMSTGLYQYIVWTP